MKKKKHQRALSHLKNQRNWKKSTKGVGEVLGADSIHTSFSSYTHTFMTKPWASENHGTHKQEILSPLTFKATSEEGRKEGRKQQVSLGRVNHAVGVHILLFCSHSMCQQHKMPQFSHKSEKGTAVVFHLNLDSTFHFTGTVSGFGFYKRPSV